MQYAHISPSSRGWRKEVPWSVTVGDACGRCPCQHRSCNQEGSTIDASSLAIDGDGGVKRVNADGEVVCCHWQMANIRQSSVFYRLECLQLLHSSYGYRHAFQLRATRDAVVEARSKPIARPTHGERTYDGTD